MNSEFLHNKAEYGGAIFAIQGSVMEIDQTLIEDNMAGEGSLIYSMANKISG